MGFRRGFDHSRLARVVGRVATLGFFDQPILNSPYEPPTRHHALGPDGRPLEQPPVEGRRPSQLISPVPPAKKQKRRAREGDLFAGEADDAGQEYTLGRINEIRGLVTAWRRLGADADWGVTPTTKRLLRHWREHPFAEQRPFFCQIEAAETAIWLTEVAPKLRQHAGVRQYLEAANAAANPELFRVALKLATGAGKTTVMAMLIAWQTLNAVRSPSSLLFARLPGGHAWYHHPRQAPGAEALASRQLLRRARAGPV